MFEKVEITIILHTITAARAAFVVKIGGLLSLRTLVVSAKFCYSELTGAREIGKLKSWSITTWSNAAG